MEQEFPEIQPADCKSVFSSAKVGSRKYFKAFIWQVIWVPANQGNLYALFP
jgi:hypothetical protein